MKLFLLPYVPGSLSEFLSSMDAPRSRKERVGFMLIRCRCVPEPREAPRAEPVLAAGSSATAAAVECRCASILRRSTTDVDADWPCAEEEEEAAAAAAAAAGSSSGVTGRSEAQLEEGRDRLERKLPEQ